MTLTPLPPKKNTRDQLIMRRLFLQSKKKATGITINFEKPTVLPINTENTEQLQEITPKITIKKQFETIKILGIYFNENLKNVSQINWDNILEKMEKHINKLSPRILSLYHYTAKQY